MREGGRDIVWRCLSLAQWVTNSASKPLYFVHVMGRFYLIAIQHVYLWFDLRLTSVVLPPNQAPHCRTSECRRNFSTNLGFSYLCRVLPGCPSQCSGVDIPSCRVFPAFEADMPWKEALEAVLKQLDSFMDGLIGVRFSVMWCVAAYDFIAVSRAGWKCGIFWLG